MGKINADFFSSGKKDNFLEDELPWNVSVLHFSDSIDPSTVQPRQAAIISNKIPDRNC
jgi:hypothetical protein